MMGGGCPMVSQPYSREEGIYDERRQRRSGRL
jgi:hypothetical protein